MEKQMTLSEFAETPYFKATQLKEEGEIMTISSSPKVEEKFNVNCITFHVTFGGKTKVATVKQGSRQLKQLITLLGKNEIGWVGKSILGIPEEFKGKDGTIQKTVKFQKVE